MANNRNFKCLLCGYIHDEAKDGPFEKLEKCPMCGAGPDKFVEVKDEDEE